MKSKYVTVQFEILNEKDKPVTINWDTSPYLNRLKKYIERATSNPMNSKLDSNVYRLHYLGNKNWYECDGFGLVMNELALLRQYFPNFFSLKVSFSDVMSEAMMIEFNVLVFKIGDNRILDRESYLYYHDEPRVDIAMIAVDHIRKGTFLSLVDVPRNSLSR